MTLTLSRKEQVILAELDRRPATPAEVLAFATGFPIRDVVLALSLLLMDHLVAHDEMGRTCTKLWRTTRKGRVWLTGDRQLTLA